MDLLLQFDTQLFSFINQHHNKILDFLVSGTNWMTEGAFLWLLICFFIFVFDKTEKKSGFNITCFSSWFLDGEHSHKTVFL